MSDVELFRFEHDFVETLRCIPMAVRFKLDLCGVKVSLRQWSRFSHEERTSLLVGACACAAEIDAYRDYLIDLVEQRTQEIPKPLPPGSVVPWEDAMSMPDVIRAFAASIAVRSPSDLEWSRLSPLRRFVLLKLSRDNHDNVNFIPALKEFGLFHERSEAPIPSYSANA